MIIVSDIYNDVQSVLGTCSPETTFNKINEAIEELANISNWDPMVVYMDICTSACEITLPDDIEVPLAINIGGQPADFRNKWFEFHLNGPGSECCPNACSFAWSDKGEFPTFRDPIKPSTIAAYPEGVEQAGLNLRVYGYDNCEKWIMEADCNGVLQDGFDVPILSGLGKGIPSPIKVKRITRISKPVTASYVKIVALDPGSSSGGTLLGIIRPYITEPSFRRITVAGGSKTTCCTTWVRMRARRKVYKVSQLSDFIPLHSVTAIKQMVMSIRKYEMDLAQESETYRLLAKAALEREQRSRSGPNQIKMQFQHSYAGQLGENLV